MVASLIEEAEAIGWYEQRISVEKNPQARALMRNAQKEEFKHFGMSLEFLVRNKENGESNSSKSYSAKETSLSVVRLAKKGRLNCPAEWTYRPTIGLIRY